MKNAVIVFIDTTDTYSIVVAIEHKGKRYEKSSKSAVARAQALLPILSRLLAEHKLTLAAVSAISVRTGPGSFTGLRVGCAVANALGLLLGVPVNGKRALAIPVYS
jgi:tRNA threonylcarbamoyl adenosine modification protein YeaZ